MEVQSTHSELYQPNLLYWADVFRVLGIRRFHPFWTFLGIPACMTTHPEKVFAASEYFWDVRLEGIKWEGRILTGYSDPDFENKYELGVQALLRQTFSIIDESYPLTEVTELRKWASRNIVDDSIVQYWSTWDTLLSRDGSNFHFGGDSLLLPNDVVNRIRSTWELHYPINLRQQISNLFNDVLSSPLSVSEKRMVALEVSQPGDKSEFDMSSLIRIILGRQRAFLFWSDLKSWAGKVEFEAILWWAYSHADEIGLPTKYVVLPPLD